MRDELAHLGSNQQGYPHRPRKPLHAAHEEDIQLTAWLERVGTLNAIAAILDATRKQQTETGQQSVGGSDTRALGLEGFGRLSGAMTAAIQQIQADGNQEPRIVSIPMELQVAPVAPLSPNSSTQGQCGWVRVVRLSIHLPVPPASSQLTNPELESELFSCSEVARELNYQESTIRRCAKKSWLCGPGPYPLRGIPGFYVVTRPNPACGRGHGWKFQRIKATCNASSHLLATQSRGRARHNKATQSCHRDNICSSM